MAKKSQVTGESPVLPGYTRPPQIFPWNKQARGNTFHFREAWTNNVASDREEKWQTELQCWIVLAKSMLLPLFSHSWNTVFLLYSSSPRSVPLLGLRAQRCPNHGAGRFGGVKKSIKHISAMEPLPPPCLTFGKHVF